MKEKNDSLIGLKIELSVLLSTLVRAMGSSYLHFCRDNIRQKVNTDKLSSGQTNNFIAFKQVAFQFVISVNIYLFTQKHVTVSFHIIISKIFCKIS